MRKLQLLTFAFFTMLNGAWAQGTNQTGNAMASEGKIYVVLAVCLVILFGLLAYLVSIDRKISKKEQSID